MVYQEYISDKHHLHLNSTKWSCLSGFVQFLGREGLAEIDETEKGWFIKWLDRNPDNLARHRALEKKLRAEKTEEEWEKKLLEEQIQRAHEQEPLEKQEVNLGQFILH
jgi:DNA/RNA-binding protein KIN17